MKLTLRLWRKTVFIDIWYPLEFSATIQAGWRFKFEYATSPKSGVGQISSGHMVQQNSTPFMLLKSKGSTWPKNIFLYIFLCSFICWTQQNNLPWFCLTSYLLFKVGKFAEVMLQLKLSWERNRNILQQECSATTLKIQLFIHLEPPWPLARKIPHFQLCASLLAPLFPQNSLHLKIEPKIYILFCAQNFEAGN